MLFFTFPLYKFSLTKILLGFSAHTKSKSLKLNKNRPRTSFEKISRELPSGRFREGEDIKKSSVIPESDLGFSLGKMFLPVFCNYRRNHLKFSK